MGCAFQNESGKSADNLAVSLSMLVIPSQQTVLANYEISKNAIGQGAFGRVHKALDRRLGVQRAIKIIRRQKQEEKQLIKLSNQLAILKLLDHPNIIKVYDFCANSKFFFIVTQLCQGGQLIERILLSKSFTELKIRRIFRQLLYSVSHCHQAKVCHRDIKPENILFENSSEDSTLKLVDFGISIKQERGMNKITGTANYMAPQVISGFYDNKCDIWSCGVILYLIVYGQLPFRAKAQKDIFQQILHFQLKFPTHQFYSKELVTLLKRMLTYDPKVRPSAVQLLNDPWFKADLLEKPVSKQIIENMKGMRNLMVLQKASLLFIANNFLKEKQKKELLEEFNRIDRNKDGKLSRDQILQYYKTSSPHTPSEEINRLIDLIDLNNSNYIDYSEFVLAACKRIQLTSEENLRKAFNMFDRERKGAIGPAQIRSILGREERVCSEVLEEMDLDRDGTISFEQFKTILTRF